MTLKRFLVNELKMNQASKRDIGRQTLRFGDEDIVNQYIHILINTCGHVLIAGFKLIKLAIVSPDIFTPTGTDQIIEM